MTNLLQQVESWLDSYYTSHCMVICVDGILENSHEIFGIMEKDGKTYVNIYVCGGACWHQISPKDIVHIKYI